MPTTPIILSTGSSSGAGTAGEGREDLVSGETVTLSDAEAANAGASYLWTIEDRPIGSVATLSSAISATPQFTVDAAGIEGSYRISCLVDGVYSAVEVLATPLPITGARIPSFAERTQYDGAGNTKGWHTTMSSFMRAVDGLLSGGGGGSLDDAYNVGRIITGDAGFVEITHGASTGLRVTGGAVSLDIDVDPSGSGGAFLYTTSAHRLWLGSNNANVMAVEDDGSDNFLRGNLDTTEARFGVFRCMSPSGGVGNISHMEFEPGDSAAVSAANAGRIRYFTATDRLQYSENGGAYQDFTPTLDDAYRAYGTGLGRAITVDGSPVLLQNTSLIADAMLDISRLPPSSDPGAGIRLDMGANTTGRGIDVEMALGATGYGLFVDALKAIQVSQKGQTGGALATHMLFQGALQLDIDHTAIISDVLFNYTRQINFVGGGGTQFGTRYRGVDITGPTLTADAAQSLEQVANLFIGDPPSAGSGVTITKGTYSAQFQGPLFIQASTTGLPNQALVEFWQNGDGSTLLLYGESGNPDPILFITADGGGGAGNGILFDGSVTPTRGDIQFTLCTADPSTLEEGAVWYNTTDNFLRYHNGTGVVSVGAGGADADAIHDNVASEISAITAKSPVVAGDFLLIEDSAAANAKKSITVADLRITESQITDLAHTAAGGPGTDTTAIHDDTAGEITAVTAKTSPVGADVLLIEDSEAADVKKKVALSNLLAFAGGVYSLETEVTLTAGDDDQDIELGAPAYAGSLVGISVRSSAARTAGDVVFNAQIGGVTKLTATLDGTNTQFHSETASAGTHAVVVGDRISVNIVEGTGFTPDTVTVKIIVYLSTPGGGASAGTWEPISTVEAGASVSTMDWPDTLDLDGEYAYRIDFMIESDQPTTDRELILIPNATTTDQTTNLHGGSSGTFVVETVPRLCIAKTGSTSRKYLFGWVEIFKLSGGETVFRCSPGQSEGDDASGGNNSHWLGGGIWDVATNVTSLAIAIQNVSDALQTDIAIGSWATLSKIRRGTVNVIT